MPTSGGHGPPRATTSHSAAGGSNTVEHPLVRRRSGRLPSAVFRVAWAQTLLPAPGCDKDPWPEAKAVPGRTRATVENFAPGPAFDKVLAAAQTGAGWARTRLYEWLAPVVDGYLRARGAGDPEDLTNEAFVRVFSGCGSFSGDEAQFRSWVLRIAHCRLVDARRARNRRPEMESLDSERRPLEDEATTATAEEEALRSLGTERTRKLLDALTPDQRDVLALRVIAGLTVKEVASSLAKQPGAVKSLHRRALAALRRKLATETQQLESHGRGRAALSRGTQ